MTKRLRYSILGIAWLVVMTLLCLTVPGPIMKVWGPGIMFALALVAVVAGTVWDEMVQLENEGLVDDIEETLSEVPTRAWTEAGCCQDQGAMDCSTDGPYAEGDYITPMAMIVDAEVFSYDGIPQMDPAIPMGEGELLEPAVEIPVSENEPVSVVDQEPYREAYHVPAPAPEPSYMLAPEPIYSHHDYTPRHEYTSPSYDSSPSYSDSSPSYGSE